MGLLTAPRLFAIWVILMVAGGLPATAQDASGAAAPLQTLLDAVPQVVASALFEAQRDATPDQADRVVARMETYVAGFEEGAAWPSSADAASLPMDEVLGYARELVDLTATIPSGVAAVERNGAACASWQANATAEEVVAWAFQARPATLQLAATADGLDRLGARPPLEVDSAPLGAAVAELDAWLETRASQTSTCLYDTAARLGVPLSDDYLTLVVLPRTTWPQGTLTILGGALDPARDAQVRVHSDGLGLDVTQTLSVRGTYYIRHIVPENTTLERHVVTVTSPRNETSLSVTVGRVPVHLRVSGDEPVPFGTEYRLRFSLATAVPGLMPPGTFHLSGPSGGTMFANETFVVRGVAPEVPGNLTWQVTYAGDARHRPVQRDVSLVVYDPALAGPGFGFAAGAMASSEADGAGGGLEAAVTGFFGRSLPFVFDWEVPVWVALVLGVLALFVAWEGAVWLRARHLAKERDVLSLEIPDLWTDDAPEPPLPRSFTSLFVDLYRWALRVRIAKPSETLREVAGRYARGNPALVESVRAYEDARYGPGRGKAARSGPVARRLVAAWQGVLARIRRD